ncbi:hypothetical protein Glove_36g23 [Diversispora epigaea]|uniref:Protein kinase domain-containing protein n=1 Tax=Diversispora epigaea TaxID=1348612 RepID=A0A397JQC9_9GLOM|nr:hypothetical protein Glove_36g23 [Diversispora epigaea]
MENLEYSKLKNIEYLAKGKFDSIWKAEWIDMPERLRDLELCRLANETLLSGTYGVLPYIAPEALNIQKLQIFIVLDLLCTPQSYVELMKKYWHKDPSERLSAKMILDISNRLIGEFINKKTENSLMFLNTEQKMYEEDEDLSSAENYSS